MTELTDNPMLPIEQRLEIAIGGRDYFKECHKNARRRVEALEAERDTLAAVVERQREKFEHIMEYWNRDQNESAMSDALYHIIDTAEGAIALSSATALALHDAKVLEQVAGQFDYDGSIPVRNVAWTLRDKALRLRAGGEG